MHKGGNKSCIAKMGVLWLARKEMGFCQKSKIKTKQRSQSVCTPTPLSLSHTQSDYISSLQVFETFVNKNWNTVFRQLWGHFSLVLKFHINRLQEATFSAMACCFHNPWNNMDTQTQPLSISMTSLCQLGKQIRATKMQQMPWNRLSVLVCLMAH